MKLFSSQPVVQFQRTSSLAIYLTQKDTDNKEQSVSVWPIYIPKTTTERRERGIITRRSFQLQPRSRSCTTKLFPTINIRPTSHRTPRRSNRISRREINISIKAERRPDPADNPAPKKWWKSWIKCRIQIRADNAYSDTNLFGIRPEKYKATDEQREREIER